MKSLMLAAFVLLILLASSCHTGKNTHVLKLQKMKAGSFTRNPIAIKNDQLVFEKTIAKYDWAERDTLATRKMVFAKSYVQMVEVNKHRSDFDVYDYHYCEANKTDSSLVIWLKQYAPYEGIGLYEGIIVEFTISKNDFTSRVHHWSDTGMRPESKVVYDNLILWGNDFEKGDTLNGRIKLLADSQNNNRQIFKGNFNVIVR